MASRGRTNVLILSHLRLSAPRTFLAPRIMPLSPREAWMEQQIRFCSSNDGVRIACATTGDGPPLVKAANWLSHVQFDLDSPVWRHWIEELSRFHRYVRYDERGCGLSDWKVPDFSFDAWVRDLEAVVDSLGLERFALLGVSQGGPVGIAYAVRHPERVTHLVLYGSYCLGWANRDLPAQAEEYEAQVKLTRFGWGGIIRRTDKSSRPNSSRGQRRSRCVGSTSSNECPLPRTTRCDSKWSSDESMSAIFFRV